LYSASIYLTEKLWKRNRKAAVWTMIGIHVGDGGAVAHNYRLAARQRR
jgi:hypothetical protein